MSAKPTSPRQRCSLCREVQLQTPTFCAEDDVYVCDGCVILCYDVLQSEEQSKEPSE